MTRRLLRVIERLEDRRLLAADLVITELAAKNESGLADEDGDFNDWIEISNLGDEAIDLDGWALTDDDENISKWRFPAMSLDPGAVQIVFASNKDRSNAEQPLHTNFRLDRDGETLALVNPTGQVVFAYDPFPVQFTDVSYGLPSGQQSTEHARYFSEPSPGELNPADGFVGKLDGVQIDLGHGFYESPQTVTIAANTTGASLAYTLDGTDPGTATDSAIIVRPASEADIAQTTIEVNTTTTLRVAEVFSNFLPSVTRTQSYLFVDDIIQQSPDGATPEGWPTRTVNGQVFDYGMDPDVVNAPEYADQIRDALLDLPSLSVVMDGEDIYDRSRGFFVNGERARDDARAWERPTSIELIHPDGAAGFQIDAGIRMRGGFSRRPDNPKHAFRLFFREQYGEGKLDYPLFGEEGTDEFDKLDLRTAQVPSWSLCWPVSNPTSGGCKFNTMLRDVLARDLQGATGQPYTRSRFYHLYLNGQYWGLFQSQERADAAFAESYFGGDENDYDVVKVEAFPHHVRATHGTLDAWRRLWQASIDGFEQDEDYLRVQGLNATGQRDPELPVLLDVDNLIDYMLVTLYTGNLDGPISNFLDNEQTNNWFGIYDRNGEHGFKFFVHDSEWILFDVDEDRNGPWPAGSTFEQSNPQWLHQQLMANKEYRLRFADRAQLHLFNDGLLTPARVRQQLDQRADEIDLAIIAESARWGDTHRNTPFTKSDWLLEVDRIREEMIPARTDAVVAQLHETRTSDGSLAPLLPRFAPPGFAPTDDTSGTTLVTPGTMISLTSEHAIYYTANGDDPRAHASVTSDDRVIAEGASVQYHIPLDDSVHDQWMLPDFDDASWSTGTVGIGFDPRQRSFPDEITSDIESEMRGINSSIYVRIPFTIDTPSEIDFAVLRIKYDDGFVAYLNGHQIASRFAEPSADWNATATESRDTLAATVYEQIGITPYIQHMRSGENILALHGLNRTVNNSDFLLLPEVVLGTLIDIGASSSAMLYDGPIAVNATTTIRTRAWHDGVWGTIVDHTYAVDRMVGDVNEDGRFSSSDLVQIFQAGHYEDNLVGNSTWFEGDWNGDEEFTSSDLVLAFQIGHYSPE